MKLLTHLLSIIERFLIYLDLLKVRREERGKILEELNDEADRAVERAEAAVRDSDPDRDERLRSRFDRSAPKQPPTD